MPPDGLVESSQFAVARWVFLRALGAVHLVAFVSLWIQVQGLIGSRGILPVQGLLDGLRGRLGWRRWAVVPTLFWFGAGDRALHAACAAGVVAAAALIADVAPACMLLLLWVLYLSLTVAGQEFLFYQWDVLLLETTLVGVAVAPWRLLPGGVDPAVPLVGLLLVWWLLFRLMFQSGVVKLTSGDPTWRDLTALHYHYYTQPLPTWVAWFGHHTPSWFKRFSVALTLVIEIALPLLLFAPRELRLVAAGGLVALQALIALTGNYNFFNLLSVALVASVVDDGVWREVLPAGVVALVPAASAPLSPAQHAGVWLLAGPMVVVGAVRVWQALFPVAPLPGALRRLLRVLEPFRSINGYGLFRVMTTRRPEIIVEGSMDGVTWREYEFRFKPGDVTRRPRFVAPHQPRLDWQMWFAALSRFERTPWFTAFLVRLLEGSPSVTALLARDPFGGAPPRYVRARLFDYRFTTPGERRATGAWWRRTLLGPYGPELTLGSR